MGNAIEDGFTFLADEFELWFRCCWHPDETAAEILDVSKTPRERVRAATTVWFASLFLSLVIVVPVQHGFGLGMDNVSYSLCWVVAQYIALVSLAWFVHRALLLYRIPSTFVDTFVLYTIGAALLAPLAALVTLPRQFHTIAVLRDAKLAGTSVLVAVGEAARLLWAPEMTSSVFAVLSPVVTFLSAAATAVMIRLLAGHYHAGFPKTLKAVALGLAVFTLPALTLFVAVNFLLIYAFVKTA